jgi:1,4-dihydroxy-6-naphthoate synthase
MTTVHLGISTCPNDTFAFHALTERMVDTRGLDLRIDHLDVEDLNRRLASGQFDVAKASYHAAMILAADLIALPVGSAIGFGVGPVLLAREPSMRLSRPIGDPPRLPRVLCPGTGTTATLLLRLFHPAADVHQVVFSDIIPALLSGTADMGVCIHEGRFTYRALGLHLIEDLGTTWEKATRAPLPLGGIFARRTLDPEVVSRVVKAIRASLDWALRHKEATLPTMRRHAQDLDDGAIWAHVDLYVNAWTRDLGIEGRRALRKLSERARKHRLLPPRTPPLEIWEPADPI